MRSDLAVKWLSLISIKSEQVSKICSMVKRLSHPMHIGGVSQSREQCRSESIGKMTKRNVCTEQFQSESIGKMTKQKRSRLLGTTIYIRYEQSAA